MKRILIRRSAGVRSQTEAQDRAEKLVAEKYGPQALNQRWGCFGGLGVMVVFPA